MGNIIQHLRGSVVDHSTYTGKKGEISLVTDASEARIPTGEIRIHDDSTPGGLPIVLGTTTNPLTSNIVLGSGVGINFHNYGSEDSNSATTVGNNLLDDYEEGTWTPVCENNSGTQTTLGSGVGKYTKIGNIVFLTFGNRTDHGQSLTAGSNTYFLIKNLPFTQFGGGSYDFSNSSLVNFSDYNNAYSLFNLSARSSTGNANYIAVYNKSSVNLASDHPLQLFHMMITS